jgi:hypothetical protein
VISRSGFSSDGGVMQVRWVVMVGLMVLASARLAAHDFWLAATPWTRAHRSRRGIAATKCRAVTQALSR